MEITFFDEFGFFFSPNGDSDTNNFRFSFVFICEMSYDYINIRSVFGERNIHGCLWRTFFTMYSWILQQFCLLICAAMYRNIFLFVIETCK